jgi:hypothetical protein
MVRLIRSPVGDAVVCVGDGIEAVGPDGFDALEPVELAAGDAIGRCEVGTARSTTAPITPAVARTTQVRGARREAMPSAVIGR